MTRLLETDIDKIEKELQQYENIFIRQTGYTMEQIAKKAVGISKSVLKRKVAVIPITSGLGVIKGFSQAVGAILRHCQIETVVVEQSDVAGLQQAYVKKCSMAFLADDSVCAAFGIGNFVHSDNGEATGKGYAAALIETMKNRGIAIKGERILILGAGAVGRAAAIYIEKQQGIPVICDIDRDKAVDLVARLTKCEWITAPATLREYTYIIDASTSLDFITDEDVTSKTIVAAPGMPCGATKAAREKATIIHNPLELGIITMYYDCIKQLEG